MGSKANLRRFTVALIFCVITPRALNANGIDVPALVRQAAESVVTIRVNGRGGVPVGQGTGFFVGTDTLVTNVHVLGGIESAVAITKGGSELPIKHILDWNPALDVALVRVETKDHHTKPLPLADALPEIGSNVIVIGSPKGLEQTVSSGIVSALRGDKIQFTAAVSPGSSGSPILNGHGKVVGIVQGGVRGGQALNLGATVEAIRPVDEKKHHATDFGTFNALYSIWSVPSEALEPCSDEERPRQISWFSEVLVDKPYLVTLRARLIALHIDKLEELRPTDIPATEQVLRTIAAEIKRLEQFSSYFNVAMDAQCFGDLRLQTIRLTHCRAPKLARRLGELLLKIEPENSRNYACLGTVHAHLGDKARQLELLREGFARDQDKARGHFSFAYYYASEFDWANYAIHRENLQELKSTQYVRRLDEHEKTFRKIEPLVRRRRALDGDRETGSF
ncbi:MAG TPA: serine protease [Tepidisphaeraceae bacterium]|nr:serine protease [Tepidisphaeraceae bacterium]